jgi:type II secretory pathway pseudopilin PulG
MMRPSVLRPVRGFTLIEVVVVIAFFVIMMLILVRFFVTYSTSALFDRAMMSTASSAGAVVNEVTEYGLSADQVVASRTFGATNYISGSTVLVLEMPAIDGSGVVVPSTYDYVVFYTDGPLLYRTLEAGSGSSRLPGTKLLSDSIGSVAFTYATTTPSNASSVTVDVTTEKAVHQETARSNLSNTVYLRNYSL